ncbi:hybrid sensor histidine kinase/response regulator [Thiocystis violascens]|uniref:hybrid sensor histidine kinase/response regulator n=1 Tax=Thiocystis violascens TaxID=73141 RepID=UPI00030BEF18|nr:response regulator [Thiocystis violascens]
MFFGVALLVSALTTFVLFQVMRDQAMSDLRQRLGDLVGVAAAGLDADLHVRVTPEAGMDSDAFRRMKRALQAIRDGASDLQYVYSLRLDADGAIRFVVDAEEDPADTVDLGTLYDDASALLRRNAATLEDTLVETEVYTDRWGTWLSGYAPIRTADGVRVGVLGADISVATLRAYELRVLGIALAVFAGTLPLILLFGWWMGRLIARPIVALNRGALRIAEGDLDVRLDIRRGDEIGILGRSFDRMAAELAEARRRLEEVAAKYRSIFDNAAEGIFQSTPDGQLVTANRAMLNMLGYADLEQLRARVQDLGWQVYVNPADRQTMLALVRESGAVDAFEAEFRRADGSSFWAEISLRQVRRGAAPDLLEGMMLDLTERRRRQQAERERESARAANEAKSGFLANMSHEIRTPLNAVMGLTDLLLRTRLDARQRDYLAKVKISARALLAVINDILDFSKIEAGRLELEHAAFSLDEVLANLTEMFAYRAHERDIELIVSAADSVPRALVGDPTRLGQILINLTGNAIKFTERGEVAVTVTRIEPPSADPIDDQVTLCFTVRDTGPGIPENRLEAIFQSFSQADGSITRLHGGTGLGLAIARQLAELMGGGIRVESQVGKGSCFRATVVLSRQLETDEQHPVTPIDLRGLRVLVVEDNATSRDILISQIQSFQMAATAVASGEEALERLSAPDQIFDLVLMDWKMPGLNGLETTRRIRADLKLDKTPVICMISGYAREDLMRPAERAVLDAFLHKPVNQSFLFDTIMGLFGHQEAAIAGDLMRPTADTLDTPPDFTGQRVLLVEDIEINRLVAMEWLASVGLEVDIAENGAEAIERLDPARHAAVLMDLQMPVMDGLEATRRIRARPEQAAVPIIAMTAHALKGDLERCLAAGMNDYVAKPVDPARLFAALARWIKPAAGVSVHSTTTPEAPEATTGPLAGLSLPGIDLADGLARANRNAALYLKMLRGFNLSWAEVARRVEDDLAAGRLEDARRAIHSVKGVAGNLGAKALYERGQAAERMIAEGAFDPASAIWCDFSAALDEVAEGLETLPPETGVAAPLSVGDAGVESGALRQGLAELVKLLDDDLGRAQAQLERLRPALIQRLGAARVDAVRVSIDDFDIDAAIASVKQMQVELERDD